MYFHHRNFTGIIGMMTVNCLHGDGSTNAGVKTTGKKVTNERQAFGAEEVEVQVDRGGSPFQNVEAALPAATSHYPLAFVCFARKQ